MGPTAFCVIGRDFLHLFGNFGQTLITGIVQSWISGILKLNGAALYVFINFRAQYYQLILAYCKYIIIGVYFSDVTIHFLF